jgi:CRISPR-associated protein Csb2
MPSYFCLSIRFLDPAFHGRRDGGLPEWPPSPLRVFQSLVATAARQRVDGESALRWLEIQPPPVLIAPVGVTTTGYRLSVPNNAMDIVASAWCRGNYSDKGDASPATHRTMKTVRPTHLLHGDAAHYLWLLPEAFTDEIRYHVEMLSGIASSVVAVGWGVDMAVGHGATVSGDQADALHGERWFPRAGAPADGLRVPVQGTLDALRVRHERFLSRLDSNVFTSPPPLSSYATAEYRRATDPPRRPVAAFSLIKLDASGFRAFGTTRRALTVAGMMRHAAKRAAQHAGWSESKINSFILGHGESKENSQHVAVGPQRFAYLPLPSIEARGQGRALVAGSVRRGMLTAFGDECEEEVAWARRALSGQELIDEDKNQPPVALLSLLPATDKIVRRYTQPAASWATVTPVVLPGYDDPAHYRRRLKQGTQAEEQKQLLTRLNDRIEGLLRKAIIQAGFSQVLADHAKLEWRKVGFWPGADPADRYGVPDHLRRFPRLHVRINWRDALGRPVQITGPICIGGGRFCGLGLFAALAS